MADITNIADDHSFVSDCCRFLEGLIPESAMRRKYSSLSDKDWEILGDDEVLCAAVELERLRRIRDGSAKRESAQHHVVKAPDILNGIMADVKASPKHRIDSAKALDMLAANSPTHAPASDSERFTISIILSADEKLVVDKQRGKIDPNDGTIVDVKPQPRRAPIPEHETDDTAPQELLPLFAASKRRDGGNGNPL
jgi:hypothetical protein